MDVRNLHALAVIFMLAGALGGCTRTAGIGGAEGTIPPVRSGTLGGPDRPPSPPPCAATGTPGAPVAAKYPTRNLPSPEEQQRRAEQGVGGDVRVARTAALGYLADVDLLRMDELLGLSVVTDPDGRTATVYVCRTDGRRIRVEVRQAFPDRPLPIWIVTRYSDLN